MTPMERIERELQEARQRIAELERHNVGLANESCAQQEQINELKNALTRQAKAAKQGMDAAKKVAGSNLEQAKRLHAESSPEALESERAANAALTEQIAELEREVELHRAAEHLQISLREKAEEREQALAAHVERMQEVFAEGFESTEDHDFDAWEEEAKSMLASAPATSLARHKASQQADKVEELLLMTAEDPHHTIRSTLQAAVRHLRHQAGGCMQKPRLRPSAFAPGRWQCRGGPMKHGEYLTGYGATPNEAWLAWRVKHLEYEIAND